MSFLLHTNHLHKLAKIKKTKNNLEFFSRKSDRSERYTILITGEISQYRLVEIAQLFYLIENIKNLFTKREYSSIEEVISERNSTKRIPRKRD